MATISLNENEFSVLDGQIALKGKVEFDQVVYEDNWHTYRIFPVSKPDDKKWGSIGLVRILKKNKEIDKNFGVEFTPFDFWDEILIEKSFQSLINEIEKQIERARRRSDAEFEWEYAQDGVTLKNVVYLGKFPKISYSWGQKGGDRWVIIFPGTHRIEIPQVHVNLERWWNGLASNVRYAIKSFRSIKSAFVELQQQFNDGDESSWEVADGDSPYYVCALFADGKHIPLPILQRWVGQDGKMSGGLIQQMAILLAGYYSPKNLEAALEACQEYVTKG